MRIGSGDCTYEWIEDWAKIPESESAQTGWAHHGMAVSESGQIIASHPGQPAILVFDRDGNLQAASDTGLTEAHGITIVKEGDSEYLWIADNGSKRSPAYSYEYQTGPRGGQVVKMTLDGHAVAIVEQPHLPVYADGRYSPTWVAVNEERHGGNGDVWVADGYGQSHVHRYSKDGQYVSSINGSEGEAGAFSCPHGVWVDTRKSEPELYVADRSNRRIQVYDLDGHFKRAFGPDFLTSPCCFATHGDRMIVAELRSRVTILDEDDNLVCHLGENDEVAGMDGFPNMKNDGGEIVRTNRLVEGKFNSPHGIAADQEGNIYVAEWLIGGRMIKLVPASA
jgi:hypothetical protein